jgi:hypothetical protein
MATATDTTAARFRAAIESWDLDAAGELFHPEIVFHSPVTFHPYTGRDTVRRLLGEVAQVFENFRYTGEAGGGELHALFFRADVGEREIQGLDLLRVGEDGQIVEFTVMLRPLSGLVPFAQAMAERVTAAGLETTRA